MTAAALDVRLPHVEHAKCPASPIGRAEYAIEAGLGLFTDTEDDRAPQILLAAVRPDLTMTEFIAAAGDLCCVSALVAWAEHNETREVWEGYRAEYRAILRGLAIKPGSDFDTHASQAVALVDELAAHRARKAVTA